MKCDRSHKRSMLVRWGLRRLGQGAKSTEVEEAIHRMMRRTVKEVEEFVKEERP